MGIEDFDDNLPNEELPEADDKQEKIKELTETVDFWIDYAKNQLKYLNEVYSVEKMDETTDQGQWVRNSLNLYSAMVPKFEEIKKYLDQGKLEFPWGVNIETEVKDWEDRRQSR